MELHYVILGFLQINFKMLTVDLNTATIAKQKIAACLILHTDTILNEKKDNVIVI